jgi:predicted Holliday junction resolvase-like endonuclease
MFLILIGVVFIITMLFAVLIWRQTIKLEKSALAAKQRQEAYLQQLEIERQEALARELESAQENEEQKTEKNNEDEPKPVGQDDSI